MQDVFQKQNSMHSDGGGLTAHARQFPEGMDHRMIGLMRLLLAASALLIVYIDPSEHSLHLGVTYGVLVLYNLYSAALYFWPDWHTPPLPLSLIHWIDVGWSVAFIALTGGTSSIYFYFFFFAILVASFKGGFSAGLRVAVVSTVLFTAVGLAVAPKGAQFELNRSLLRPVYLLVLGYMIAYWGGLEVALRRRLALLRAVGTPPNLRFGSDRTINNVIERLRDFYDADVCLITIAEQGGDGGNTVRHARRHDETRGIRAEPLAPEVAAHLLSLPATQAAIKISPPVWSGRQGESWLVSDAESGGRVIVRSEKLDLLAAVLDAASILTVPLHTRTEPAGRLFLLSDRPRAFKAADMDFVLQVFEQVAPILENVRLVERLASAAAEQERGKVARDIHDSVIQPYIGLQLGLAAICQKLELGGFDVSTDARRLLDLTKSEIDELRGYMRDVREGRAHDTNLLPALRRFARKFGEAASIDVRVESAGEINLVPQLAGEVFQMVSEALSNIRRHTRASRVTVMLACRDGQLAIRVRNNHADGDEPPDFTPRSIAGRARALGGQARVEQEPDGWTAVVIEIPL